LGDVNREDFAWAAGVLEGEGCFLLVNDRGRRRPTVRVSMTDQDIILRLRTILGVGTIVSKRPPSLLPQYKDRYVLSIDSGPAAYYVMVAVFEWMGERRQAKILEICQAWIDQGQYIR
jgi:hypothetical protein